MDGKKAYSTFNGVMLGFLILIALSLAAVLLFTKSSVFSKIDEHGCNNSGGYTFSYAKAKCIKIYENCTCFCSSIKFLKKYTFSKSIFIKYITVFFSQYHTLYVINFTFIYN